MSERGSKKKLLTAIVECLLCSARNPMAKTWSCVAAAEGKN